MTKTYHISGFWAWLVFLVFIAIGYALGVYLHT
jgi:hypothetical protein